MRASTWSNDYNVSSNVSKDTVRFTKETPTVNTASITIALLSLCSLGVPGNMLVILTYARNMTPSLRVYVLALAFAESAICGCVVIHAYTPTVVFVRYAVTYVVDAAVTLSMFVLGLWRLNAAQRSFVRIRSTRTRSERGKQLLYFSSLLLHSDS